MSRASQAHKIATHGANSVGERALLNTTAIADPSWTNAVLITPIDASLIWTPAPDAGAFYTLGGAPTGVTIDSGTGSITGTPTVSGTFTMRVGVTDTGSGEFVAKSNSFTVVIA